MTNPRLRYFDHNATTRVHPDVVAAMLPFLTAHWGNPSSAYRFGHEVAAALERSRAQVAGLIGAEPREIVFTGCGTESDNAALQSAVLTQPGRRHLVTTAVEHSAIMKQAELLRRDGIEVTFLPVDGNGLLDLGALDAAIRPDTALVSIMWANNETGVLFPVAEASAICRKHGVLFHTDAVQAAGKVPVDVRAAGVDFLSLSAHKLHAPKGVGALFIRAGVPFRPLLAGGGQERGLRGGTENVPSIVGFGTAAALATNRLEQMSTRIRTLRDRLEQTLLDRVPATHRNGAPEPRLPNTSNLSFQGLEAEGLLLRLDALGVCVSTGSACASASHQPSHVLMAMHPDPDRTRGSVRFSLGHDTSEDDVDFLLAHLPPLVEELRAQAP